MGKTARGSGGGSGSVRGVGVLCESGSENDLIYNKLYYFRTKLLTLKAKIGKEFAAYSFR